MHTNGANDFLRNLQSNMLQYLIVKALTVKRVAVNLTLRFFFKLRISAMTNTLLDFMAAALIFVFCYFAMRGIQNMR